MTQHARGADLRRVPIVAAFMLAGVRRRSPQTVSRTRRKSAPAATARKASRKQRRRQSFGDRTRAISISIARLQERQPQERSDVGSGRRPEQGRFEGAGRPLHQACLAKSAATVGAERRCAQCSTALSARSAAPLCHLDQFQGDGTTARLAGQQREYLQKTMTDFRDRTRANNPGMSDLLNAVAPANIAPLAQYLSGLQITGATNGQ